MCESASAVWIVGDGSNGGSNDTIDVDVDAVVERFAARGFEAKRVSDDRYSSVRRSEDDGTAGDTDVVTADERAVGQRLPDRKSEGSTDSRDRLFEYSPEPAVRDAFEGTTRLFEP